MAYKKINYALKKYYALKISIKFPYSKNKLLEIRRRKTHRLTAASVYVRAFTEIRVRRVCKLYILLHFQILNCRIHMIYLIMLSIRDFSAHVQW
jgi:hypothetical protein